MASFGLLGGVAFAMWRPSVRVTLGSVNGAVCAARLVSGGSRVVLVWGGGA